MSCGPDFGYGAQPGEYGGIGPFGYGSQPGEYGIDANHGIVPLLQSLQYGSAQGPSRIPAQSHVIAAAAAGAPRPARRSRRLVRRILASLLVALGLVLASPAAPHQHDTPPRHRQAVHHHRR